MENPGNQSLAQLLADLSGSAGQRSLSRTLATLKASKPKASFYHICELQSLAGEITTCLSEGETARQARISECAEESFASAIDLMVELKFKSAAQPTPNRLARPKRDRVTLV